MRTKRTHKHVPHTKLFRANEERKRGRGERMVKQHQRLTVRAWPYRKCSSGRSGDHGAIRVPRPRPCPEPVMRGANRSQATSREVSVPKCNPSTESRFGERSEEHTSELQSLMRISYAVFCLKKKKIMKDNTSIRPKTLHTIMKKPTRTPTHHTHKSLPYKELLQQTTQLP